MIIARIFMLGLAVVAPFFGVTLTEARAAAPGASAWEIGPIIRGRNYSVGMPLQPTSARRGWYFDFPYPHAGAGHVHYVTFNNGPLIGKRRIVMRYRIDAAPGVRFVPQEFPDQVATISLYFQQRGDSWSPRRHEHYRWYAADHRVAELRRGENVIAIDLDEADWVSLRFRPGTENPFAFGEALENTGRVGFVLGSSSGRGHGVYATGPARLTVLSFELI